MDGCLIEPVDRAVTAVRIEVTDTRALELLSPAEKREEAYCPVDERVGRVGLVEVGVSAHVVLPRCSAGVTVSRGSVRPRMSDPDNEINAHSDDGVTGRGRPSQVHAVSLIVT